MNMKQAFELWMHGFDGTRVLADNRFGRLILRSNVDQPPERWLNLCLNEQPILEFRRPEGQPETITIHPCPSVVPASIYKVWLNSYLPEDVRATIRHALIYINDLGLTNSQDTRRYDNWRHFKRLHKDLFIVRLS